MEESRVDEQGVDDEVRVEELHGVDDRLDGLDEWGREWLWAPIPVSQPHSCFELGTVVEEFHPVWEELPQLEDDEVGGGCVGQDDDQEDDFDDGIVDCNEYGEEEGEDVLSGAVELELAKDGRNGGAALITQEHAELARATTLPVHVLT